MREEVQVSSVIAITEGGTQEEGLRQDTNSRGTVERSPVQRTSVYRLTRQLVGGLLEGSVNIWILDWT